MRDQDIDRRRIFVTGLSAGGAMTLAMLATYPDVFAAGAVIAGLPLAAQPTLRKRYAACSKLRQNPPRVGRSGEGGFTK